ncbi:toxin Bro [Clostridioides difficile]|uniref:BRO-N domain-containing protein n=2 Tax=Clostridioides difficile TaxID=1496 RepID=UPI000BB19DFA|nr:BRO family protein [Clostridioides difficile]EGT5272115.1 toxin Bro [Clostridioides difficile]EGT5468021.1 toxin Bro [Clostridioides difficile]MBY1610410.1 toxin Bro [Clostridioides difficile]MBY2078849.1 toxin Bro [Clostridioides difficile]MBY2467992.1 toxin Bro [Clostridioides difficile]
MSNNLQIFKNNDFGEIRTVEIDGKPYFVATDIARCLGYKDTTNAIKQHCKWVVKHHIPHPQSKTKTLEVNVIPEGDMYRLITNSELPSAEKFEHWVFDEVLPSIRKTGTYSTKSKDESEIKYMNAQARLKNARVREAKIYLELADKVSQVGIPEFAQVMYSKTTELLSGETLIPLPKIDKKTYSATEVGKMLGISANKVGGLANAYNLKTEEYGIKVWDKAKYSDKQVPNFRYYENVIPVLEKALKSFEN